MCTKQISKTRLCPLCVSLAIVTLVWSLALAQESPATASAPAGMTRMRMTINEGWRFLPDDRQDAQEEKHDDSAWAMVDVPHTWNASDPFDDAPAYRRGPSWYRKRLELNKQFKDKRLFLYFEGVHQKADVYVNGKLAGRHKGGYTAFCFEITRLVSFRPEDANVVAVRADSGQDEDIPPLDIGFAHYGGIYRDVWLIATDPVHLDVLDHASPGIFVDTPEVSAEKATVRVRGTVLNESDRHREIHVTSALIDPSGAHVAELDMELPIDAGQRAPFQHQIAIASPRLWSPASPTLYRVVTVVKDGQTVLDRVSSHCGFRWFTFDPDKGFFLNGESLPLRGASRHQDYAGLGSALPNSIHRSDLEWLKRMGANFIRLAHYPQDPEVLETADRLGIIVWEEIPIVSTMSPAPSFAAVCENMLTEMIRQHYNHPSVVLWGYMNEVLLNWGRQRDRDPEFPKHVLTLAKDLDSIVHREDPARVSVMAMDARETYDEVGISDVPQVAAWNIYAGWYSDSFNSFGKFMDRQHEKHPKRIIFVSEYGAGSDGRLHAFKPRRFDHSAEWQRLYHESHIRQIRERPYLAGVAIWNEFDFSQPEANDSIVHMNQKGMLTFDRQPKDTYYLYQANWSKEPVLHIASREWIHRSGTKPDAKPGSGVQPVDTSMQVYSNLDEVELSVDGRSIGVKKPDDVRSAVWAAPLHDGWNLLEARGHRGSQEFKDSVRIHFTYRPPALSDPSVPFQELAVNVGGNVQYIDPRGLIWEADQSYKAGGWGYVGGQDHWAVQRSVTRLDILGTQEDPLYQALREQIQAYRFAVPDGEYELELRFTEYFTHAPGERVFRVTFNRQVLIDRLDLAASYGVRRAVSRTFQVQVEGGQRATVGFEPIVGESTLSAIRIRRIP